MEKQKNTSNLQALAKEASEKQTRDISCNSEAAKMVSLIEKAIQISNTKGCIKAKVYYKYQTKTKKLWRAKYETIIFLNRVSNGKAKKACSRILTQIRSAFAGNGHKKPLIYMCLLNEFNCVHGERNAIILEVILLFNKETGGNEPITIEGYSASPIPRPQTLFTSKEATDAFIETGLLFESVEEKEKTKQELYTLL